jgi:hypothetical protein
MVNVDGRQIAYLPFGQIHGDTVIDRGHHPDRDGDFLPAPQVSLLQKHVRDTVIARVDDKPR